MNTVAQVKEFVKNKCLSPNSKYGAEPFEFHFVQVVKRAKELAKIKGGDIEVIEIAAWLHDIGSIVEGRKDHHLTGAKIAEQELRQLGYPEPKIKLVKLCILNHRGSQDRQRTTIEEKIIAEADAMSNFDNIPGIFKAAFIYEGLSQGEAREAVRKKLQNKWSQLHFKESRELLKPKYDAVMLLLS